MAILVLAEHNHKNLNEASARVVQAASAIGGDVHLLILGQDARGAAEAGAKLAGVSRVFLAQSPAFAHFLAEPAADFLLKFATPYDAILAPATAHWKNILPRLAALLDVQILSGVTKILGADCFERPIYAGNALQQIRSRDAKKVLTIQATSFSAVGQQASPAPIEEVEAGSIPSTSRFVAESVAVSARPDLSAAKIVVSGGRALGSAEKFREVLEPLADKLGAAIGASRAAVDAGYAPNDLQVGQTGKVVAPELYIACGISGAIQHLAGMKDSKVIVAINKDPDAPIFQVADYGLVADLFEIVPSLTKNL